MRVALTRSTNLLPKHPNKSRLLLISDGHQIVWVGAVQSFDRFILWSVVLRLRPDVAEVGRRKLVTGFERCLRTCAEDGILIAHFFSQALQQLRALVPARFPALFRNTFPRAMHFEEKARPQDTVRLPGRVTERSRMWTGCCQPSRVTCDDQHADSCVVVFPYCTCNLPYFTFRLVLVWYWKTFVWHSQAQVWRRTGAIP